MVPDGQLNFFDLLNGEKKNFKIRNKVRLIELFAGISSQSMALRDLGVDYEDWKYIEFDKYPVASRNAIFGSNFEPQDITKITAADLDICEREKYTYIMTYSFPCQDLSVAGLGKGCTKGSGTRSGLLWEVERLLNECGEELPQVLLMENVKNLIGAKNKPDFDKWCSFLESKGYHNFYKVMNAKNYGVAQNRERVFMVSLLADEKYEFPEEIPLEKRMKDYLEEEVDKKYYITSEKAKQLIDKLIENGKIDFEKRSDVLNSYFGQVCRTIKNQYYKNSVSNFGSKGTFGATGAIETKKLGNLNGHEGGSFAYQVYDKSGVGPTLTDMQGGGQTTSYN